MGRPKLRPEGATCVFDGCDLPQIQRDWCSKHYMRWYRHGDASATGTPGRGKPVMERLDERLDKTGGAAACWEYQGARHRFGYGDMNVDGVTVRAHRLAWEIANGPITDGLHVLHRCDNPPCCNPAHLFLGTNTDNQADMRTKGRDRWTRERGLLLSRKDI